MLMLSNLRGFGAFPVMKSASSGGDSSGIPRSDYIKQLQCLINYCINAPDANKAWQSSKELWNNAVAWDNAVPGGLPVTGTYRTAWPTENDAIWMLNRAGIPEFAAIDSALQPVDSNLLGYIQSCLQFLGRQPYGYFPNIEGCNFPARTAERLAAAAAAAAAAQAAAQAAADAQTKAQADAAALAAAQAAAQAAAVAKAEAAAQAAAAAAAQAAAQNTAEAAAAAKLAERAAAAATAAAANQQQQQQAVSAQGSSSETVSPGMQVTSAEEPGAQTVTAIPLPAKPFPWLMIGGIALGAGALVAVLASHRKR